MSEYAIEVEHIKKTYMLYDRNRDRVADALGLGKKKRGKEHHALNDVSFQIKKGESVGIIGTNGSGKSTILKIITGVLNPTEGNVTVNGRISALLELGAGFNMEYTGIQNVYLNGTMMGFSEEEIDQKLDSILAFADIGDYVYQPVKTYSSGMFVRLAFAVAINIDPEILIVDEALSVGDVYFQSKCYKKFEEFKAAGKTILFVSHDLGSISKYCDRAILLNKGNLLAEGLPNDIIDIYKKVLVGQYGAEEDRMDEKMSKNTVKEENWKSNFEQNPNCQDYGDHMVEIVDYAVLDNKGRYSSSLIKDREFSVRMKIRANAPVEDPIAAFTIRDVHGTEISGTNTMVEKKEIGPMQPGEEKIITFTQRLSFQGGSYLVSLGCTRFENDAFQVYQRLYDVCGISVISDKNTVGFFDMNSVVEIQ
ncbi:MAG: ABC transporter ATP-binding protein [Agathobacter sp.]